jgi:cytochrome c peroxidase
MKKLLLILFILTNIFAYTPITPINDVMVNKAKAKLGMKLFFDFQFSANKMVSCRNCHNPMTGWADAKKVSMGVYFKKGTVQSPTVLNSVYNFRQFWNGRAKDLKDQIDGPIHNPVEMGINGKIVEEIINKSPYKEMFAKAYFKNHFTYDDFKDAIANFEYFLTTPNCKFDKYLEHKVKLSKSEMNGYKLFKSVGCIKCHDGENIGGGKFAKAGVYHKFGNCYDDRYAITHKNKDKCVYKVPTLRNINLTAPYFHDARTYDLKDAIKIEAWDNCNKKLTKTQINDIYNFLLTLEGDFPHLRELMR